MQIQINGEVRELAHEMKLSELIEELALAPERIAIELNHQVVRRNEWTNTIVADSDRIEVVHFVGGGTTGGRRQEAEGRNQKAASFGRLLF